MALPTLPHPQVLVTLGVDTHADSHVAVALDQAGRPLGTRTISTTPGGYAALLGWGRRFGTVDRIGVEGTGSYGAGLARWLRAHGQLVIEVDRPDRAARRRQGKADDLDAHAAARAVQAGTATSQPKAGDGTVEMIRSLRLARRSAVKARTQAANQLASLVVTAPEPLIPVAILRNPIVRCAITANAFGWGSIVGLNVFLPMYLQGVMGLSPTQAGLSLVVLMLALNTSAGVAGQVLGRVRHYKLLPMGALLLSTGAITASRSSISRSTAYGGVSPQQAAAIRARAVPTTRAPASRAIWIAAGGALVSTRRAPSART